MTSAPMSPSTCVATGPNTAVVRSTTRMPASGPDMPGSHLIASEERDAHSRSLRRKSSHRAAGRETKLDPADGAAQASRPQQREGSVGPLAGIKIVELTGI